MFPANDNYIGSAVLRSKILINVAERQVMGKAVGYIQKAAGFGRKAAVYKQKAAGFGQKAPLAAAEVLTCLSAKIYKIRWESMAVSGIIRKFAL